MALKAHNRTVTIGLFDSGVGGLSVLRRLSELSSALSSYQFQFVYVGDTARCPYGNRRFEEIAGFIAEIVSWLGSQQTDHIVMACNTSASIGSLFARQISPSPVHDLIAPSAFYASQKYRRIGVLATHATVATRAFSQAVQGHRPEAEVTEIACPALVPLVESGQIDGLLARQAVSAYTGQLLAQKVEAIIFGCTHFPFLERTVRELVGEEIELIDPAQMLLQDLICRLGGQLSEQPPLTSTLATELPVASWQASTANTRFYVTGDPLSFAEAGNICLGKTDQYTLQPENIFQLSLEELSQCTDLLQTIPQSNQAQVAPSVVSITAASSRTGNSNVLSSWSADL